DVLLHLFVDHLGVVVATLPLTAGFHVAARSRCWHFGYGTDGGKSAHASWTYPIWEIARQHLALTILKEFRACIRATPTSTAWDRPAIQTIPNRWNEHRTVDDLPLCVDLCLRWITITEQRCPDHGPGVTPDNRDIPRHLPGYTAFSELLRRFTQ